MASGDAVAFPIKGAAYRLTVGLLDADGDPVVGATGLDSEVSKDGAAFADATNEAAGIGNGLYTLDLTAAEMDADTVAVAVKSTEAKTALAVIVTVDNTLDANQGTAQTGDSFARIGAAGAGLTALGDARLANLDAAVSSRSTYAGGAVASVTGNVGGNVTGSVGSVAAGGITAASIATDAIDADALAADAANKIADHTLRRSWATAAASADGDAKSFRSLLGAVAKLVNRFAVVAGTATVYEADDTTSLGTQTVTTDPDADHVTGLNTDG